MFWHFSTQCIKPFHHFHHRAPLNAFAWVWFLFCTIKRTKTHNNGVYFDISTKCNVYGCAMFSFTITVVYCVYYFSCCSLFCACTHISRRHYIHIVLFWSQTSRLIRPYSILTFSLLSAATQEGTFELLKTFFSSFQTYYFFHLEVFKLNYL